jgi:hypothetical protein
MRTRTIVVATLAAILCIPIGMPAGANTITRTDGNEVAFPLDLAEAKISHASGRQVIRLQTHGSFSDEDMNGDRGWFRIGFDTGSGSFERTVYIQHQGGRVRGILTDGDGDFIRLVSASRVASNAVEVRLGTSLTGSTLNYRMAAWTVWRASPCSRQNPCLDWLPNDGTILHDLAAPAVTWRNVPDPSTEASNSLSIRVPFTVRDVGGYASGVSKWILSARDVGSAEGWFDVKHGKGGGAFDVSFTGQEGRTFQFRVWVVDKQDNARYSKDQPRTTFPFDDAGEAAAYGPVGAAWLAEDGLNAPFLKTRHTSTQAGARATFAFKAGKGVRICVVGGPSEVLVTADATLDGASYPDAFRERPTTLPREVVGCVKTTSAGPRHTLRITADAEGFGIDGLVVG